VRSPYASPKSETQRCGAAVGAIVATLSGSDTASAEGITVTSPSPVLALCRKLIDAGFDPATFIHVFRGDTLALIVRSLAEGARLEINHHGTGFRPRRGADAAPPMRHPSRAGVRHRARRKAA
jgi:hypothetical protein